MKTQLNRADLLRARASGGQSVLVATARLMGLKRQEVKSEGNIRGEEGGDEAKEKTKPDLNGTLWSDVPFWLVVEQQSFIPAKQPEKPADSDVLSVPIWRERPTPLSSDQSIDKRQLELVRAQLWQLQPSRKPHVGRLVRRVSECCPPNPLPLSAFREVGVVRVIVDRARHLMPWCSWQQEWLELLLSSGLRIEVAIALEGQEPQLLTPQGRRRWQPPAVGSCVLLLSDAGVSGALAAKNRWQQFARQLRSAQCRALLLSPVGYRAPGWQSVLFTQPNARSGDADFETLLTLCSFLARLEPQLALRLCTVIGGSSALVARLWQHGSLSFTASVAAGFHIGTRERYRGALSELCCRQPDKVQHALHAVRQSRAEVSVEIWYEEIMSLPAAAHPLLPVAQELYDARNWYSQLDAHRAAAPGQMAHEYLRRSYERGYCFEAHPEETKQQLSRLYRAACGDSLPLPKGYDPSAIEAVPAATVKKFRFGISGVGGESVLEISTQAEHESGRFLGSLRSLNGEILLEGEPVPISGAGTGSHVQLPRRRSALLRSDLDSLRIARITKPQWASAIGRDRFGLWCEISLPHPDPQRIPPVRQRLRYCPPGEFWMGSPEEEEDRYGDEGPQHRVRLSEGFWIFDTPVTQMLWTAVMGDNPSGFKGDLRPVESVGFERCTEFLEALNKRVPDLNLMLPTEAQWEYACRAGSEGARYGVLDDIAWYGDNANKETHPVAQKLANAWGLYDTLGNVYEWCRDGQRGYGKELKMDDPIGGAPGVRAVRGGSWVYNARRTRAAYRNHREPVYAVDFLGFRCLRVQNA